MSLVRVTEDGRKQELPIRHQRVVIGRETDCDVRVPTPGVSRHHCELVIDEDGPTIRDLGSSNGTYVNQERIDSQALSAGDLIAFGRHVFVVQIDGRPAEIDPEACYEDGRPEPEEAPEPPRVKQSGGAPAAAANAASGDDSSVFDFDFDLSDEEEDDQPPL